MKVLKLFENGMDYVLANEIKCALFALTIFIILQIITIELNAWGI